MMRPWQRTLCASVIMGNLVLCPSGYAASADDAPEHRLRALLAMPFASDLTGARNVPVFAWVENRAGARNILVSRDGATPIALTHRTHDDGIQLWDLALAPDGRTLAYVEGGDVEYPDDTPPNALFSSEGGKQSVHVILPSGADRNIGPGHSPVFSPDGKSLAFSQGGSLFSGAVSGKTEAVFKTSGTIMSPVWSPDGTRLAFVLDRGTHAFIGLWSRSGGTVRFLSPALARDILPAFSPDGTKLAFVRTRTPPPDAPSGKGRFWSVHVHDLATDSDHELWAAPEGAGNTFSSPENATLLWTRDGHLVFPWEGSGWRRLCSMTLADRAPSCLTPEHAEVSSWQLAADGKSLFYTANPDSPEQWSAWSQPLPGGTPSRLTSGTDEETSLVQAGSSLGIMTSSVTQTLHPVVLTEQHERHVPVEPVWPEQIHFVSPRNVSFRSSDGVAIHGQLFIPEGRTHPGAALVFAHGGPHRQMLPAFNDMDYYSNAYLMNQTLASQGYVVLTVNYRGGTGYGEAFRNAPQTGEKGASEYADVLAAARYLQQRPDVDPHRIGIWGGSWGGYLTALALARNSDIFAVGVDFHGVHDMTGPDLPGRSPAANRAAHDVEWASSPIADIARWRSPVLLVHGDDDRNVEFEQSILLARMLSQYGISYQDHAIPNERHTFLRNADWLTSYLWAIRFLADHLDTGQENTRR